MSYENQCRVAFAEHRKLAHRIVEIEKLASSMDQSMKEKDQQIIELQTRLRHLVLTRHAELDPADLDVPDPLFHEAAACQLYTLSPETLVHLLLKKEQLIQQLLQHQWRVKADCDRYRRCFTRCQHVVEEGAGTTGASARAVETRMGEQVWKEKEVGYLKKINALEREVDKWRDRWLVKRAKKRLQS